MKMSFVAAAVVAVAGLAMVSTASAGHIKMTDATGFLNGSDGTGGAFIVNRYNDGSGGYVGLLGDLGSGDNPGSGDLGGGAFYTFCIERSEHISFQSSYYTDIRGGAVNGGYTGQTQANYDPVSNQTAALYRAFRYGTSLGTVNVPNGFLGGGPASINIGTFSTSAEIGALQHAIWYLEGEWVDPNNGNQTLALTNTERAMIYWAQTNASGLGGVRALTLWTNSNFTGNSQDMLTIIPLPPAAYAGLGTLAGVLGFGAIRRRRLRAE